MGMALCLVIGLYWMIGKWFRLYGVDTKRKKFWILRLGIAAFAGGICLAWKLCGDIVEEGTTRESMQEAFQVLGKLESTYGTYFVYGNHDRQGYRKGR